MNYIQDYHFVPVVDCALVVDPSVLIVSERDGYWSAAVELKTVSSKTKMRMRFRFKVGSIGTNRVPTTDHVVQAFKAFREHAMRAPAIPVQRGEYLPEADDCPLS
ncbi:MAG: hypothetical protein PHF70_08315 [Opitutales bacterium]|nr:hypothetical protein [Opitutales bacterium]